MGPSHERTALVTGAGQGIGAAIARALHAAGLAVAAVDVDAGAAAATAAALRGGPPAAGLAADVRDEQQLEAAFTAAAERLGPVDVVVNNAARTEAASVWDVSPAAWDEVLAVNLRGVLFGCRIAGRRMRGRGWGRIINLGSLAGQAGGTVAGPHYAASKAGIVVLTKIFAQELAAEGVTVNAVAPAAIDGPVMQHLPSDAVRRARERIPLGRFGTPVEVAATVAFLASAEAGFITGATVDVNGGLLMR
jgi:3-oxoacyl-[acyl-carrier protein] reductase